MRRILHLAADWWHDWLRCTSAYAAIDCDAGRSWCGFCGYEYAPVHAEGVPKVPNAAPSQEDITGDIARGKP